MLLLRIVAIFMECLLRFQHRTIMFICLCISTRPPNSSGNIQKHGYLGCFNGIGRQRKYFLSHIRITCCMLGCWTITDCSHFFPGCFTALKWRHNQRDGVSNHRRLHWLLNCWFRWRSKKISKLRITWPLCPHKGSVTRKMFPFDDVTIGTGIIMRLFQ